jgi:hypothetical protein
MDVLLLLTGIRALARAGGAGSDALLQYQRDKAIRIPDLEGGVVKDAAFIVDMMSLEPWRVEGENAPLSIYWDQGRGGPRSDVPRAKDVLQLAALEIYTERFAVENHLPREETLGATGATLLSQWAQDKGPVGPLRRFLVTLADAGLELVGANPSLLGIGGPAEKLVGALAANLAELVPDDAAEFGPRSQFADRLFRIFLRAGLVSLEAQSEVVIPKRHLAQLARNLLQPVIAALPSDLAAQSRWRDAADALVGPAAQAAFATLTERPAAFLGRELDPDNALGALAKAMLETASEQGVGGALSETGLVALYRAALGVAAERPELFLPGAARSTDAVARALFQRVTETLADLPSPFDDDLGVALVCATLAVVEEHAPRLRDANAPWEDTACTILRQVVEGLRSGLAVRDPNVIQSLLSRGRLLALARVFVEQAARTPRMRSGADPELGRMVAALAEAIAADPDGLLGGDDWLTIAKALALEVAANPGRLFPRGLAAAPAAGALLVDLVSVAREEFRTAGRDGGCVLFGPTLCEAATTLLRSTAAQAEAALEHREAASAMTLRLSQVVRSEAGRFGSREWLWLYRRLLPAVLAGAPTGRIDGAGLARLLEKGDFA